MAISKNEKLENLIDQFQRALMALFERRVREAVDDMRDKIRAEARQSVLDDLSLAIRLPKSLATRKPAAKPSRTVESADAREDSARLLILIRNRPSLRWKELIRGFDLRQEKRARAALKRLLASGEVVTTGKAAGTRYRVSVANGGGAGAGAYGT